MFSELDKAIIKIIIYFDMFDYPLSALEIWQYLPQKYTYQNLCLALANLQNIACTHGLYSLENREGIVITKQVRYNLTEKKFKRAIMVAKIFRWLPWIKMIAVANLIGAHNAKIKGDIDLLIITESNQIWLTRLFCVSFLKIFNLRPTPQKSQDKICLSFFTSIDNLNFEPLLLNQSPINRDRYFTYWLANLYPIYNQDKTYEKLIKANSWLHDYLPNWQPQISSPQRLVKTINNKAYLAFSKTLLQPFHNFAKKIQLIFMAKELKTKMNQGTEIVVNDQVLKLHAIDRRQKYYEQYLKKIKQVLLD